MGRRRLHRRYTEGSRDDTMNRRTLLTTTACGVVLAGCLGNNDFEDGPTSVVAHPYDTAPPEASTTSVDDPKIEGVIKEVVVEAIETNATATQRLDEEEREAVTDQFDDLPWYEGDDEFSSGAYVTRDDDAAAVFLEVLE